jgi:hypothetical protein
MTNWDTFELFESLLHSFDTYLTQAERIHSSHPPGDEQARIAVSGFLLFQPPEAWGQEEYDFITARLSGELSLESLEWYEDNVFAVQAYSCLALGAMLGKWGAGMIDEAGFTLGEAHLASFIMLNIEAIHERYSAFRTTY